MVTTLDTEHQYTYALLYGYECRRLKDDTPMRPSMVTTGDGRTSIQPNDEQNQQF